MLTYQVKEPFQGSPRVSVIWLHGLGASGSDLMPILSHPSLSKLPISHVFVDAPHRPVTLNNGMTMRAWYDIFGIGHPKEDLEGMQTSHELIVDIVNSQKKRGFSEDQIILAGFSQGGAMALYTALRMQPTIGGVIALSAWLPSQNTSPTHLPRHTPFFMGLGQFDQVVLPEWTKQSAEWLSLQGYKQIVLREYPMEHTLSIDEIRDIANWLSLHPAVSSEVKL